MTNQTNQTPLSNHTERAEGTPSALCAGALLALALCIPMTSCGEEEAPPAPIVRAAPTPPPPPEPEITVKSIAELMKEHNIDERVQLEESAAPETTEKRVAVLKFWNAFAKSDAAYAGSHLSDLDRKVLDGLSKSGAWTATTSKISTIEVQCKDDGEGFATFAVITADAAEQPMLFDAVMSSAEATFTAFPGPPDIIDHLSGEDSIGAWKTYVDGLFEKYANLPDEVVEIPQTDLQPTDGEATATTGGNGDGPGGGGGGGGGELKKRPHPPLPN